MHEKVFPLVAFTLGSLVGLAEILRSKRKLTARLVYAAMLWHGLMSMGSALLLWSSLHDDPWKLYGLSIACGAGAFSAIDLVVAGVRAKLGGPGGGAPPAGD